MSNQSFPQPGVLPKNPKLSVCMIVRDEEEMLPRCLKSVQGVADELILVDTGSKDNTISIAKDFGAKVYHFKWGDDFATARNEYLKHATGDWILHIDADEELLSGSTPHLKESMLRSTVLYYVVRCDNGPRYQGPRFSRLGRLFRRHPKVRYHRPYHEGIDYSVKNLIISEPCWQVQDEPSIIIRHYGYEPSKLSKKRTRGLPIMKAYLKENPNDAYILTKLGGVCYGLGRYEEADTYLNKALKINPDCSETNYHLGLTLKKLNKLETAIRCYKKAIAVTPELAEAYVDLGNIYIQKEMLDIAILELKKALDINPDLGSAHNSLGLAYKNKGMFDESITEFEKAIAVTPELAEAYVGLGNIYIQKEMLDIAILELKKALDINPDLGSAHYSLGLAYSNKGMWDEAISEYKHATAINPDFAEAHNNLAVAYYSEQQYALAIRHCDKAVALGFRVHPGFLQALKTYR